MLQSVHYDYREVASVYGLHGLRMADATVDPTTTGESKQGRRFVACLALALIVGYFVSFGSMLLTEYGYESSMDTPALTPINDWGARANSRWLIVEPTVQYTRDQYNFNYSPVGHMAFGFVFTGALSFLRLRFTGWPLHPIGYLMIGTFPGHHLWFSIMIGWMAKTLIVRFGGPRMFVDAKPFFLGLIVGESAAAGLWLVMGIGLGALGMDYRPVNIMPG
jgi:hypothetical protein